MSVKRRLGEKVLMPIVAAGTSAAVGYVVRRGPGFVEDEVWPRLREAAQGVGGVGDKLEKLPDPARLTGQLAERAKNVTGSSEDDAESTDTSTLSADELSRRSEERARRRAARRKTTNST